MIEIGGWSPLLWGKVLFNSHDRLEDFADSSSRRLESQASIEGLKRTFPFEVRSRKNDALLSFRLPGNLLDGKPDCTHAAAPPQRHSSARWSSRVGGRLA